jgi:hypothetical protein
MQNEDALKTSILKSPTWEQAIDDFIKCTTDLGQPFTSGHITTILRVYRPELRFSHYKIGEICQNKFYDEEIKYGDDGAVQIPRICAGLGRTPAGTTVFCYGHDEEAAEEFPFELDIPEAGAQLSVMPTEHPLQPNITIKPTLPSKVDMRAKVHSDYRLCVPRVALEGLLHATGRALRGGDRVWVRFDDAADHAIVSFDQVGNGVDYGIGEERGRVLFAKPGSGQFQHGDIFGVEIVNDELVVDLSKAL